MSFTFIRDICESKLIPNKKHLHEYDSEELAELAFINILALRILMTEHIMDQFTRNYCRQTAQYGNFKRWQINGTDLYVMLYGLISDEFKLDRNDHHVRIHMPIDPLLIYRWFRAGADHHLDKDLTHRLFVKLDTMFRINDSSLRAIRRLVMDWETIHLSQKRLALTRLLQFMRVRAAKGELLSQLNRVATLHDLEIDNVDNPETGELKEENLLLTFETASSGATASSSVAAVVGGLGAGFDDDYSKSVYPAPKKTKPKIIRRRAISS